ncbi:glycoside hydrolase family 3 N-terminal domain-containing protein [Borreliella japonica]|nr:glycoside hydrolase family 3 protein [Borreliella japonica]WKC89431.1 glycoside hydrolase family 3 protein [Borreliella japonica]
MEREKLVNEMVSKMQDHELLGQMFMISYPDQSITNFVLDFISKKNLGGIKIFGWNAKNLKNLTESINKAQKISQNNKFKIPLFVATDQEGGLAQHVKSNTSETIGNLGIAASLSPEDSYNTGYYIAQELSRLGINLNFAPIVDIYSDENNFTIGPRTYSDNPRIVSLLSLALYKGQKQGGIISTAKHFPGHGNTDLDSHINIPIINSNLLEINLNELLPYKILIQENIPVIMTGHLAYPKLTNGENIPASSSTKIIKDILRNKLKYNNIIITDDLLMNAAKYNNESIYNTIERIVRTKSDIFLISLNEKIQKNAYNMLLNLMKKDLEIKNNIIESNKRILRIKLTYLKENKNKSDLYPNFNKDEKIYSKEGEKFFEQNTLRGITKVRIEKEISKTKKTLIISPYYKMIIEGKKIFQNTHAYYYDYYPLNGINSQKLNEIKNLIKKFEQVIFNLSTPGSLKYLENLEEYKDKISVIVSLTPQHIKKLNWIKNIVIIYGTTPLAFKSGFLTLTKDFDPKGTIPLRNIINKYYP